MNVCSTVQKYQAQAKKCRAKMPSAKMKLNVYAFVKKKKAIKRAVNRNK